MIKNILAQVVVFFCLFLLISWFKEIDLLDSSGDTKAPAFSLLIADSNQRLASTELNGKPTLIYFWAPWCTVCKLSMPNLSSFYQSHQDEYNVIAVALSYESEQQVTDYIKENEYSFPVLLGSGQTARDYKVSAFPTYYVLDTNGNVVSKSLGYSTEAGMMFRTFNL